MNKFYLIAFLAGLAQLAATPGAYGQQAASGSSPQVPTEKQTVPGLYVTAKEAYDKWRVDPASVKILDVRTTEEYLFIGHPTMAWNIPVLLQTYQWDSDKKLFPMKPNPDFVSQVKEVAGPNDTILVMCRSGGRSAMAVNLLANAGYQTLYNIIDGMEGDAIVDLESVFHGQRMKNGWKNSGLPWTYHPDYDRMRVPQNR